MLNKDFVESFRAYEKSLQTGEQNPRLAHIANTLLDALYPVILELRPTREEWDQLVTMIDGLDVINTRLMLWLMGLTQLVEEGNANLSPEATQIGVEGPFFVPDAPLVEIGGSLAVAGEGDFDWLVLDGTVRDLEGKALADVELHIWASDEDGAYSNFDPSVPEWQSRGRVKTNDAGYYSVRMPMPECYEIPGLGAEYLKAVGRQLMRPKHVHFLISDPDYEELIMQVCFEGDPYNHIDSALAVKEDHIIPVTTVKSDNVPGAAGLAGPFHRATYDFKLQPVALNQAA